MISVLIPAYNEANRIGQTLERVHQSLQGENFEVIVVDDGSRDATTEMATIGGARVLTLATNQGKGRAMNQGVKMASGDILLLLDADLGESAGLIEGLVQPIVREEADLTIARFPQAKRKGGFGLVKGLAHHGLYLCTGNRYYSPISGQRALRRQVLEAIGEFKPGWGMEVAMTIDAHHSGFRILEVPLEMSHRETGRNWSGFVHRGEQFRDIFFAISRSYWRYHIAERGRKNFKH